MTTNLNIKGIDFTTLTDEQKQKMAQIFGVSIDAIEVKKAPTVNNLVMKSGSDTIAIDIYSKEEFDITTLTEEELLNAKRTGLSPTSFKRMQEGEAIKKVAGRTAARRTRQGVSAGEQIRQIVSTYKNQVTSAMMMKLMSEEYRRKMSLTIPLFKEIPQDATDEAKKAMRKDKHGHPRYSNVEYSFPQIPNKTYYMSNNLFANNVSKVDTVFKSLIG